MTAISTGMAQESAPSRALGLDLDPTRLDSLVAADPIVGAPWARLSADWQTVEQAPGVYDWSRIRPAVDQLRGAGYRVALAIDGSHAHYLPDGGAPSPFVDGSLAGWEGFVRSAARTFSGSVEVLEIGQTPGSYGDADVHALVLKQSALAAQAEAGARNLKLRIAQGSLGVNGLARQKELWDRDLAAYIDVLPVRLQPGLSIDEQIQTLFAESLVHPPAPELWAYVAGDGWDGAGDAIAALSAGADAAFYVPTDGEQVAWGMGLQAEFAAGYDPAGSDGVSFSGDDGRVLGRFFNESDFRSLVVYSADADTSIDVLGLGLKNMRQYEPLSGDRSRLRSEAVEGARGRRVFVEATDRPAVMGFEQAAASFGTEETRAELDVERTRGLTAEEIIARFQLLQQDQTDRLDRWMARGRIDFHFRLAQGAASVDISVDSNYFWERDGALEWEQETYYINGNKVKWKDFPELPLLQPEKVLTLPLDLTLDKTYGYRLIGEDRVGGRECYVLAFEPNNPDPTSSLYRGRLWIDKENFARLKTALTQNNLESPVLSNEETDLFATYPGRDETPFWMLQRIEGQQVWNAAGRTFVVQREVTFLEYQVNPSRQAFTDRRATAYASSNQMLRDTDDGFRYLERAEDGSRTVKSKPDTSQFFGAVGAFKDGSQDNVVPLGGVNYFNYDLWGKGVQLNALTAGVIGQLTVSKPGLGGSRADLTLEGGYNLIKFDDQVFSGNDEIDAERIESRPQNLSLRFGLPVGNYFKFNIIGGAVSRAYFRSDESNDAIADYNAMNPIQLRFVLPEDHVELYGTAEVEFNKKGFNVTGSYSKRSRSDWEAWGLQDTMSGEFGTLAGDVFTVTGGEPVLDRFSRWSVSTSKEWFLPKFQRIRASVSYLDGEDLDRFSRYQFSLFGKDSLSGFSGTGVRFDHGTVARLGYAFNLLEIIRFGARVDTAEVELDDSGLGGQSFTGLGLNANVVGPWRTVINLDYGYALNSDIPDLEGEQEFLLLVLKLF